MTIPNYSTVHCCYNCEHVYVRPEDYDMPDIYYCNQANDRPKCGWNILDRHDNENELFCDSRTEPGKFEEMCKNWEEWAAGHKVEPPGTCPNWQG